MNPVLALVDRGLKTSQLPVETVTAESDFKASYAWGIGEGGVSAQTIKPVETTAKISRIPSNALYRRRICFHRYLICLECLLTLALTRLLCDDESLCVKTL